MDNNTEWTPQRVLDHRNQELNYPGGKVMASLRSFGGGWDVIITNHEGKSRKEESLDIITVCTWLNELQPEMLRTAI